MAGTAIYRSVAIVGAKGLVGCALGESLHARGIEFIGVERDTCDITRDEDVEQLVAVHRPTLILNCAAYTKVDACEQEPRLADEVNGYAVGRLARYARQAGAFMVHFSTDFVFDGAAKRPYRPDDPAAPLSAYGRSKLLGECRLQEHGGQRWMIVRTAGLFGRHGYCFPKVIHERSQHESSIEVVSDQVTSVTHAPELAEAILHLLDENATGIWHVSSEGAVSWYQFALAVVREFDMVLNVQPITTMQWLAAHPGAAVRPAYSALDCSALRRTGWSMHSWQEALRDYRTALDAIVA